VLTLLAVRGRLAWLNRLLVCLPCAACITGIGYGLQSMPLHTGLNACLAVPASTAD